MGKNYWPGRIYCGGRNSKDNGGGPRHAGRFNPTADVERSIVKIAGIHWKTLAQDRAGWKQMMDDYVEQFNVPWASGKQKQLDNLKPNTTQTPASSTQLQQYPPGEA